MCAGVAVMCGPPTVGGACYLTWLKGKAAVLAKKGLGDVESSFQANAASLASVAVTYEVQRRVVVSHFDEGGALSLNWKKGTESLGEPLKIQTWTQFYRAMGPPVFARTAAFVASFYVAGYVHGWVCARRHASEAAAVQQAHARPSQRR